MELPIAMLSTLFATKPYPFANALQILKGNSATGAFRKLNNALGNRMVHILLKAVLATGELLQSALGTLRTNGLKRSTTGFVPLTGCFNLLAGEDIAVAIGRKVDNAQVHTKPLFGGVRVLLINLAGLIKVVVAVAIDQIRFALHVFKHLQLAFTCNKWDTLATVNGPDIHGLAIEFPGEDAIVVSNRTERPKRALVFAVQLVGIRNLRNRTYRHLRRKTELAANIMVDAMVQVILAEHLCHPCVVADMLRRLVSRQECLPEKFGLFFGWVQLHLRYQFHVYSIPYLPYLNKFTKGEGAFLQRLKPLVSCADYHEQLV